jgi:hypothetical protein
LGFAAGFVLFWDLGFEKIPVLQATLKNVLLERAA